jgi:hypothetical protein
MTLHTYVFGRPVVVRPDQGSWKSSCFHRWRYVVSKSLQILETKTSSSFSFGEKSYGKNYAV